MARKQRPNIGAVTQVGVDLVNAAGDVATTLVVPGDGAVLVEASITIETAGTGAGANHVVTLEAGTTGDGVQISGEMTLDADGAVGLTATAGPALTGVTGLTKGVALQLKNTESAEITNGAIVNLVALFQM